MPTSIYSHIPALISHVLAVNPKSVLDIGVGNGKMGFLIRDLIDVMFGASYHKSEWKLILDGIEAYAPYIQEHQRFIYNNIYIGDADTEIDKLKAYDLIVLGDVLEHFEKKTGEKFLDKCFFRAKKGVIINVPLGNKWVQGEIYNNKYERHLSSWEMSEFLPYKPKYEIYNSLDYGEYGCILIKKWDFIVKKTDDLIKENNEEELLSTLHSTIGFNPYDPRGYYLHTDYYLKSNNKSMAETTLKKLIDKQPNLQAAKDLYGQISNMAKDVA